MLDVVYTFYRGDYESLQSHTETTNNNSNNKTVRHVGAKQPPPPYTHTQALQDTKLAPLTQHSGCHKGGCAPAAESSKGASKEAEKQLCGSWASGGTSYLCNERSWKLLNSTHQEGGRRWWVTTPPAHWQVVWEGGGGEGLGMSKM